jgi:C4-dicarboxylate transporter DctQ subunit
MGPREAPRTGFLARADLLLCWVEVTFVGAALAAASALLFANVVLRYVFLAPISWAEEVSLYLMVWIVFVGASVAARTRGHIAVDLLPLVLSPANRRRLAMAVSALVLTFLAVFGYYSGLHTLRVHASGQVTPVLVAPMWLTYLAMPVGSALMFLRTSQLLWRVLRARRPDGRFAMDLQD